MAEVQLPEKHEGAHAPQASYWPIFLAATLTLTVVGLVAHIAITIVGAVLSLGAIAAWAVERFQGPTREDRPLFEGVRTNGFSVAKAHVEVPAAGRRPGWWGLVWFIATEALFFANLISAYLYLRFGSHHWPPDGVAYRELWFPSFNTVLLLLSGVPAYYAHRAIKRGDRRGLQIGLVLAALLGAIFLAGQGYEYTTIGFSPKASAIAAGFFVLTGFHGLHVVAGIGLFAFVLVLSLRGHLSAQRNFAVEVASTYWHFVDAVWIFLFAILYLFQ